MAKLLNVILLIAGFSMVSSFFYWVLNLLSIPELNWMRWTLALILTLILGFIIFKKEKVNKYKMMRS